MRARSSAASRETATMLDARVEGPQQCGSSARPACQARLDCDIVLCTVTMTGIGAGEPAGPEGDEVGVAHGRDQDPGRSRLRYRMSGTTLRISRPARRSTIRTSGGSWSRNTPVTVASTRSTGRGAPPGPG